MSTAIDNLRIRFRHMSKTEGLVDIRFKIGFCDGLNKTTIYREVDDLFKALDNGQWYPIELKEGNREDLDLTPDEAFSKAFLACRGVISPDVDLDQLGRCADDLSE